MTKRINYRSDVELEETLTQEEEEKYIKLLENGDLNASEVLITSNLRLVNYIAQRFMDTGIEFEELQAIGRVGLIKGIDTFKSEKEVKVSTYVSVCIENEIKMFLRNNLRKIKHKEISMEKVLYTDKQGNEISFQEILEDKSADLRKISEQMENMEDVKILFENILNKFHKKEKIYILYYLAGYKQTQIGEKCQISQSIVSRHLKSIKSDLKKRLMSNEKCNCDKYKVEIEKKFYKISFTIKEPEKYQLCKDIISKTKYQACYNDLKRNVLISIDAENEALILLAQIIECIED